MHEVLIGAKSSGRLDITFAGKILGVEKIQVADMAIELD